MAEKRYQSFEEFWPFYVGEHSKSATRILHFIGTHFALLNVAGAIATRNPWYLLLSPVYGYGFAWVAHFFIEKNKPATFTYPAWSFRGDFKMLGLMWRGKMTAEVDRVQRAAQLRGDRTMSDIPAAKAS